MTNGMTLARIGDVMKADVATPRPETIVVTLRTPEAVAYANQILNEPQTAWRLERSSVEPTGQGSSS